eukprot:5899172-Pleurochrysis_carterae.AAC.2
MAFGIMNTRRYVLVYLFLATLFMNCASCYWTMWSVATISVFMFLLTDFMFFEVRAAPRPNFTRSTLLNQASSAEPALACPRRSGQGFLPADTAVVCGKLDGRCAHYAAMLAVVLVATHSPTTARPLRYCEFVLFCRRGKLSLHGS